MIAFNLSSGRSGCSPALIQVMETEGQPSANTTCCIIGRNLVFDAEALSNWLCCNVPARVVDLITLASATAFADRVVTRPLAVRWGRDIEIMLPVHDPDFWQQSHVKDVLTDTLDFVSGDCWNFVFHKRVAKSPTGTQGTLPFGHARPAIVIPYSDGLDSFAVARLQRAKTPDTDLLLVTTGRRRDADRDWRRRPGNGRVHKLSMPFRFCGQRLRETSYRTRGFLFGVMAGIAAHLSGARTVIVPESGQGTLGPWMMPVGDEAADVRTHPLFTRKLESLIGMVLGSLPRFEHPRLWHTKGETLREMAVLDRVTPPWEATRSCGRGARWHIHLRGKLAQCGVCGACLLRRQSLLAAGLDEGHDRYLWPNIDATTLSGATAPGGRPPSLNDEVQAACGALSLARFAHLALVGTETNRCVRKAAYQLATVLDEGAHEIEAELRNLINRHRNEWQALVARAGPSSFLTRWTEGRLC